MLPPPPDPTRLVGNPWIRKHKKRHDCTDQLPHRVPDDIEVGDKWRCPTCRRRWVLAWRQDPSALTSLVEFAEGVTITGPDRSIYWRPFRARFIGAIGS